MSSNEELDEQIQNILKQKELLDAKKALEAAQKSSNLQLEQLQNASEIVTQQKTIAENQKAIVEAQKGAIEAAFPKGTTTPLAGDITATEKFGYISRLVAYETMKEKACKIADTITDVMKHEDFVEQKKALEKGKKKGKADTQNKESGSKTKILIVNDLDVASSDIPLRQIESVLTLFTESMNHQKAANEALLTESKPKVSKLIPLAAAALAPMLIPGIISSVADIAGYFQTNYDIKGQDFTLDSQAIVSTVAGKITETPVYIYNFNLITESEVLSSFNSTLKVKQDLDKTIDRIKIEIVQRKNAEIKKIKDEIAELKKRLGELKDTDQDKLEKARIQQQLAKKDRALEAPNDRIEKANVHITNSESLSKAFLTFADSVTQTTEKDTLPLLLKAALRKHIRKIGITHLLNLKIISSGGEAITMKHRFLFWMTNSSFIGGSVVCYILARIDGTIIAAETVPGLARFNYKLSGKGESDFKDISLRKNQSAEMLTLHDALTKIEQLEKRLSELEKQPSGN